MTKSVAIMQPYLFPYIGYFQLVNAVDEFVFYDDVNFIKQGWINRNFILQNGKPLLFTVPLVKASSNSLIKDVEINNLLFGKWKGKFCKTIVQSYSKAPYFQEVYPIIESLLNQQIFHISELAIQSVIKVFEFLEMEKNWHISSKEFNHTVGMDRAKRLIEICNILDSHHYVNVIGGKELYTRDYFESEGKKLSFLESKKISYPQNSANEYIPNLSMIDIIMFNDKEKIRSFLNEYLLV